MEQAATRSTRRDIQLSRLLLQLEAVLSERAADGLCYDPLCHILDAMGYTRTPRHPYGQRWTRARVIEALYALHRAGRWRVRIDDISGDTPPVPHQGDNRDTIRVQYCRNKDVTR